MPTDSERLAKLEALLKCQTSMLGRFFSKYDEHQKIHLETRDKILALENKGKGAWAVIVALSAVFGAVGAALSNFFQGRG